MDCESQYKKYLMLYLKQKAMIGQNGGKKGLRPSPTESATLYPTGTIRTGNDGNKWIVAETKKGIKRWKFHQELIIKMPTGTKLTLNEIIQKSDSSVRSIYNKLQNIIVPELRKMGKNVDIILIKERVKGYFFTDEEADEYMRDTYGEKWSSTNFMLFLIFADLAGNIVRRPIRAYFSKMKEDELNKINKLFLKTFGKQYEWNVTNKKAIHINLNEK